MIASSAFFSHISCPFRRMGFCERPHCHFSHTTEPAPRSQSHVLSVTSTKSPTKIKPAPETKVEKRTATAPTVPVPVSPAPKAKPAPKPKVPQTSSSPKVPSSKAVTEKRELPAVPVDDGAAGRKRVAHTRKPVPSSTPKLSKSKTQGKVSVSPASSSQGSVRAKRPVFPLDYSISTKASSVGRKIPLNMRQDLLNKLIDEYLKVPNTTDEDAFDAGLREEKGVSDRAKSRQMYHVIGANTLLRVRSQVSGSSSSSTNKSAKVTPEGNIILDHDSVLNGSASNYTIVKKEKVDMSRVSDALLHQVLQKFVMTKDQMQSHGYPLPHPTDETRVMIPSDDRSQAKSDFASNSRICARCKKQFRVNRETGVPVKKESCVHHPGRLWTQKLQGSMTKIFSCCRSESTAAGCESADAHVVDGTTHPDYAKGFVRTKRKEVPDNDYGVYALDCEMCNTTVGMELTRVTVIDSKCRTVVESFVKPDNQILDYNTRFSGIVAGDLDAVTTRLPDIQRKLRKLFNEKTILIGHSLDSDFKALKLLHPTVIDTAHLFPHRKGLPFKRALRTIVAETMSQIIQDAVGGHDSAEDAISCMRLVLLKASEETNHRIKVKDPALFSRLLLNSRQNDMDTT